MRDLELALVDHNSCDFLLQLGAGFSFVGTQVPLDIGDQDFYLDMLFYHLKLRCYVVIELKAGLTYDNMSLLQQYSNALALHGVQR